MATSGDMTNWNEHGEASLPASLYETSEYSVSLEPLHVEALPEGGFLMVVLKTEWPQFGNVRYCTLLSLKSPDGLAWSEIALIDDYRKGVDSTFVARVGQRLVFMHGDPRSGWLPLCFEIQVSFYSYDASSNAWELISNTKAMPGSYHLFADSETFYLVRRECSSLGAGFGSDSTRVERSFDGRSWESLPSSESLLFGADAHGDLIYAEDMYFSPGTGWQPSAYTHLRNTEFNADTIVGTMKEDLVVSSDFGRSWQRLSLAEIDTFDLADWNDHYVGLVTERIRRPNQATYDLLGSSVYTVKAHASRATHTGPLVTAFEGGTLVFEAQANVVYQVEVTASLATPDWVPYGLPRVSTGALVTVPLELNPWNSAFFRVVAR